MPLDATPVYWLSAGSCALASSATFVLFCWSGYQDWGLDYAVFTIWHIAPYVVLFLGARHFRAYFLTSFVWLLGLWAIAWWHLEGLVRHCSPRFPLSPPAPGRPGPMNCAGPIVELFFPVVLFGAIFLLFLLISPVLWLEWRCTVPDRALMIPIAESDTAPAETAITATPPRGDFHVQRRSF